MSLIWKKVAHSDGKTLLNTPLQSVSPGVFEADIRKPSCLTPADIIALKRVHGKRALNLPRADRVKAMLIQGMKVPQMVAAMRGIHGCGKRMIQYDIEALPYRPRKRR